MFNINPPVETVRKRKKWVLLALFILFGVIAGAGWPLVNNSSPSTVAVAGQQPTPTRTVPSTATMPATSTPIPTVTATNTPTPLPTQPPTGRQTATELPAPAATVTDQIIGGSPTSSDGDAFTPATPEPQTTTTEAQESATGTDAAPAETDEPDLAATETALGPTASAQAEMAGAETPAAGESTATAMGQPDEIGSTGTGTAVATGERTEAAPTGAAAEARPTGETMPDSEPPLTSAETEADQPDAAGSGEESEQTVPPNGLPTTGDSLLLANERPASPAIDASPPAAAPPHQPVVDGEVANGGMVAIALGLVLVLFGAGFASVGRNV